MKFYFSLLFLTHLLFFSNAYPASLNSLGVDPAPVTTDAYSEWAAYARREVDLSLWLKEIEALGKKLPPVTTDSLPLSQKFTGQIALFHDNFEMPITSSEITPLEFNTYGMENSPYYLINDVKLSRMMFPPTNSVFIDLNQFSAIWITPYLSFYEPIYAGFLHQSNLFKIEESNYLGAVDYFFKNYKDGNQVDSTMGIGIVGIKQTDPSSIKNIPQNQVYHGKLTAVGNKSSERIEGELIAIVNNKQNLIHLTINLQNFYIYEWTIPFDGKQNSIKQNEEFWLGFYGPSADEIGGVFHKVDGKVELKGILFGKKI